MKTSEKSIKVDSETYKKIKKIAEKTKRNMKMVVLLAICDYWERL